MRQLLVLLVGWVFAQAASAQEIRVDAMLADDRPYVGSSVDFTIVVTGAHSAVAPDIPSIPLVQTWYESTRRSSSFGSRFENGEVKRVAQERMFLIYKVVPQAVGEHTIPSMGLTVGGKLYRTDPITFVALRPELSSDTLVLLESPRERVFVGEPVPVRITWYTDSFRRVRMDGPMEVDGAQLLRPQRPRWQSEVDRRIGAQSVRLSFGNQEFSAGVTNNAVYNRVVYDNKVTLDMIVIPQRAGPLTLGPITIEYERASRRSGQRLERARSKALALEVVEVPLESAPNSFTGLVGVASTNAQTTSRSAKVGDPIPLTWAVLADEPIERVDPPRLESQGGKWDGFQFDPQGWHEVSTSATARTFRTMIRARDDSIKEIPPIDLAFFDPGTERFALASTQPIPIEITPTVTISSAQPIGSVPLEFEAEAEAMTLRELHAGVLDNATGPALLHDETTDILAILRSPVGIGVIALPPVAFGATALFLGVRRRVHSADHRRRKAHARARAALASDGSEAQCVRNAIRLYIADRFDRELDTITPKDCEELLATEQDQQAGGRLAALLIQAEREQFDEIPAPAPPPVDRAREALALAEQSNQGVSA